GCRLSLHTGEVAGGRQVSACETRFEALPGESVHTLRQTIGGYRLWSTDDPFLYHSLLSLTASADEGAGQSSDQSVRFGFRDFRVRSGYFTLNGKRVFLRCSHTGNCMPVSGSMTRDPDLVMRDLHYAKALGFNAVRFIAGVSMAAQLDMCDEIGLMVYEECHAAWLLGDSPRLKEYFDRSTSGMIRRDRNHACVTLWGLLNETYDGGAFHAALEYLPTARALDPTRLILLSSGRWDAKTDIGSISNPFSDRWEYEWGYESEAGDAGVPEMANLELVAPYKKGLGDMHIYPKIPQADFVGHFIRTVGSQSKPVFLSEYGIGSQSNAIQEYLKYEENGIRADLEDASFYKGMVELFLRDWAGYGLSEVFTFPEDFFIESMRLNCRQRQMVFDLVRSNPKICGYNLTGLLDHAITGEGLWTFWREFEPGMAEAVREGWAPLRWALFPQKRCVYAGRPFTVEAVLCNEDVLSPGGYPAWFRIKGRNGAAWEKKMEIALPKDGYAGMPPLAVSVMNEIVTIDEPGEYEFGATLLGGGAPAGGRLKMRVIDPCENAPEGRTIAAWGCDGKTVAWLKEHEVKVLDFSRDNLDGAALILIGNPEDSDMGGQSFKRLLDLVSCGANAVFMAPAAFAKGEDATAFLPFEQKGSCQKYYEWLYHLDNVHIRHPLFEGIEEEGIADYEYFGSVYPEYIFEGIQRPDKTICAALGTGQMRPDGYASGVTFGEYAYGKGKIMLNCFRIEEALGANPVADRMLLNLIKCY
ncbi:MAG: glycoside hydrolase family 2 TIM barrel-domain containing protein, partial [Clostridia bacterium]|nr:glycoside hydrolase family 2 TIM barrel-domain containing protein [Clostridia bacterium]